MVIITTRRVQEAIIPPEISVLPPPGVDITTQLIALSLAPPPLPFYHTGMILRTPLDLYV